MRRAAGGIAHLAILSRRSSVGGIVSAPRAVTGRAATAHRLIGAPLRLQLVTTAVDPNWWEIRKPSLRPSSSRLARDRQMSGIRWSDTCLASASKGRPPESETAFPYSGQIACGAVVGPGVKIGRGSGDGTVAKCVLDEVEGGAPRRRRGWRGRAAARGRRWMGRARADGAALTRRWICTGVRGPRLLERNIGASSPAPSRRAASSAQRPGVSRTVRVFAAFLGDPGSYTMGDSLRLSSRQLADPGFLAGLRGAARGTALQQWAAKVGENWMQDPKTREVLAKINNSISAAATLIKTSLDVEAEFDKDPTGGHILESRRQSHWRSTPSAPGCHVSNSRLRWRRATPSLNMALLRSI